MLSALLTYIPPTIDQPKGKSMVEVLSFLLLFFADKRMTGRHGSRPKRFTWNHLSLIHKDIELTSKAIYHIINSLTSQTQLDLLNYTHINSSRLL